jgi:hypothetical protein
MNPVTYRLESELDFQWVTAFLKESNIPFTSRKYSDSAFPTLETQLGYADITVAAEYEAVLRDRIADLERKRHNAAGVVAPQDASKKRKAARLLWILYTIIITVVCLRFWYLDYRNSNFKHYTNEWSMDGSRIHQKSKESGITLSTLKDANYDGNFERVFTYYKNGLRCEDFLDLDEDGTIEKVYFYNLNGGLSAVQFDHNDNGIVNELSYFLNDGDTLKLTDANEDGVFELEEDKN